MVLIFKDLIKENYKGRCPLEIQTKDFTLQFLPASPHYSQGSNSEGLTELSKVIFDKHWLVMSPAHSLQGCIYFMLISSVIAQSNFSNFIM